MKLLPREEKFFALFLKQVENITEASRLMLEGATAGNSQLAKASDLTINPKGPDSPLDPSEPNEKKRVHRGGSFLCNDQYCSRYIVGTRGKGEVNTGTNHLGFRCVKDAGTKTADR